MPRTLFASTGRTTSQGNPIAEKANFLDEWNQSDYTKDPSSTSMIFTTRSMPDDRGETTQIGYVEALKGDIPKPLKATMNFTSHDLYQSMVRVGQKPNEKWIPNEKFNNTRNWDPKTPEGYASSGGEWDLGHLLFHQVTGVSGDRSWNQVAENSKMNREGAIYKAEELARMFSKGSNGQEVQYTVVPDWSKTIKVGAVLKGEVDEEGRPKMIPWDAPANLLVQVKGKHGAVTFFIPNSAESMQEPTKYMVNKKWVEKNFGTAGSDVISNMPNEDGYKQQFMSFFKNIAGDEASRMPLMDAVKKAYMASPIFKKQIESAGRK